MKAKTKTTKASGVRTGRHAVSANMVPCPLCTVRPDWKGNQANNKEKCPQCRGRGVIRCKTTTIPDINVLLLNTQEVRRKLEEDEAVRLLVRDRPTDLAERLDVISAAKEVVSSNPSGHQHVLARLCTIAADLCAYLNDIAHKNPQAVAPVAAYMSCWFSQIRPSGKTTIPEDELSQMIKQLGLGTAAGLKRGYIPRGPLATFLYNRFIMRTPSGLPPFTLATVDDYAEAAVKCLKREPDLLKSKLTPRGYTRLICVRKSDDDPGEIKHSGWKKLEYDIRTKFCNMLAKPPDPTAPFANK